MSEYTEFRSTLLDKHEASLLYLRAVLPTKRGHVGKRLSVDVKAAQQLLRGIAEEMNMLLDKDTDFSGGPLDEEEEEEESSEEEEDSDEDEEEASDDEDEDSVAPKTSSSTKESERPATSQLVAAAAAAAQKETFPIVMKRIRFKKARDDDQKAQYIGCAFAETLFQRLLVTVFKAKPSHCIVFASIIFRWGTNLHEKAMIVEMGRYLSRFIPADGAYIREMLKNLVHTHLLPDDPELFAQLLVKLAKGDAERFIEERFSILCFLDNPSAFLSTVFVSLKTHTNCFDPKEDRRFTWTSKSQYPMFTLPPDFEPVTIDELTAFKTRDAPISYVTSTAPEAEILRYKPSSDESRVKPVDLVREMMALFPIFTQLDKAGQNLSSLTETSTAAAAVAAPAAVVPPKSDTPAQEETAQDASPSMPATPKSGTDDYGLDF